MGKTNLGKIRVRFKGEFVSCDLYNDGTIQMPDGSVKKLNDEQFQNAKAKIQSVAVRTPQQPPMGPPPADDHSSQPDTKDLGAFERFDSTTAERRLRRKRIVKVVFGIIFFLVLVAAALLFIRTNYPELLGLAPNSYRVAVANNDIAAGAMISEADVGYIELTRDEYTAQCVETYMTESGAMKTDVPLFFVNAQNQILNHYAAEDIKAGGIIKESMVSNTNQVATVVVGDDGQQETVEGTASQFYGETTVTIIARVTNEKGEEHEVVLSSLKMQGHQLTDFLDSAGQSLLD